MLADKHARELGILVAERKGFEVNSCPAAHPGKEPYGSYY